MTTTPPGVGPFAPSPAPRTAVHPQIAQLGVLVTRLSERVDQLTHDQGDIAGLTQQLAADTAAVKDALAANTATVSHPGVPCWATMTADQAGAEWEALTDWIADTLVPWYEITRGQLPDCWALHRPAVIELSWLHHTHQAAHQPDALPHLTAHWHTDWKPAALRTIADAIPRHGTRTCGPGHHLTTHDHRLHHPHPTPTPAHITTHGVPTAPTDQLAARHHWHTHYEQARTEDLGLRRIVRNNR